MSTQKLDRNAFKAQSAKDAANHAAYYKKLSWQQRLEVAAYLNSIAFNYDLHNPPAMNKQVFKARSLKNG